MIRDEIGRTLLRATDTFKPSGALAGDVIIPVAAGLVSSATGLTIETAVQWVFSDPGPRTGWLICEGQAESRTTFADLFAKIGTKYGAGDGSTTFNVPDMRGVSPVGVS